MLQTGDGIAFYDIRLVTIICPVLELWTEVTSEALKCGSCVWGVEEPHRQLVVVCLDGALKRSIATVASSSRSVCNFFTPETLLSLNVAASNCLSQW